MYNVSPFQKYEPKDWAGFTTSNHLGAIYAQEPLVVSNILENIYKVNLGNDLISYMSQFPTLEIDDDLPYEWFLKGADEKNIALIGVYDMAGTALGNTAQPGKNFTRFKMRFGENYFSKTHVIEGEKPDLYKILIVSDAVKAGNYYDYTVELITPNENMWVAMEDLAANTRWSISYSVSTQTLSSTGSDIRFTSPFKMHNWLTMLRKKTVVPGEMIRKGKNKPLAFSFKTDDGKVHTTWLNYLDYQFYTEFRREMARLLMYGQSNRKSDGTYANIGDSGYEIRTGSGLREQIAPANIFHYGEFDLDQLIDFAHNQLSINKLPEDQRSFTLMTGEQGKKVFSRAVEQYAGANVLEYARQPLGSGSSATYQRSQFVKVVDIQGIVLNVVHNPDYDNNIRNKMLHPDGGVAESHRFTILDFGTDQGEANIRKVVLKDQPEIYGIVAGLRDPYTPGGKGMSPKQMATGIDGYELHRAGWCGMMVKNPMRCGEYIPQILK